MSNKSTFIDLITKRRTQYALGSDLPLAQADVTALIEEVLEGYGAEMSRIVGEVRLVGRPDAYEVPDVDLEARLAGLEPREPHMVVTASIRDDGAPPLRRRGVRIGDAARAGHGTYQVPVAGVQDAAAEFAEWCEAARVLEPAEVRDAVVAHLRAVVGSRP